MDLIRLAAELDLMRTGRGSRRRQLRERLAQVDSGLRDQRNTERLKLANAKARLAMLDSRQDPAPLQAAVEQSAARLSTLDLQIVAAIARAGRK
jgi:hypothetical protein